MIAAVEEPVADAELRPLPGYLLLTRLDADQQTGRFVVPDNCQTEPNRGHVHAVGQGVTVPVGSNVLFARYSIKPMRYVGVDYLMVREEDILAIVADG